MSSGCGDVLSLEDLKIAKLNQIFESEVITGKSGGLASGSDIDYATNMNTGQIQKTMPAILRDIGYQPASFDFSSGGTLSVNDRNKAVLWPSSSGGDGFWYYWEGALPKVIPASSTPSSTGGVANGAWKAVGDISLRGQLASPSSNLGDALLAVKQPYTGSSPRTQHNFNAQFVSVMDFLGDSYSGATDSSPAFATAHSSTPSGKKILVPAGTYLMNSVTTCAGRHFIFEEPVTISGAGYLSRAIIERINGSDGSVSLSSESVHGSDSNPQFGANFKFGSNAGNVSGLQVGGGAPVNGTQGNVFFQDGYSGWTSVQPSKYPSPVEFAVQPAARAGKCTTVIGTNQVTINTGAGLTSTEVGKTIWLKDAGYTIASVGSGTITVTNLNGTAVSFASSSSMTYLCCYIWGVGKCNVSGTSITRLSGDPFIPLNNVPTTFVVNGVTTTQSGYTDSWSATLSATAGTASNVDYYWWGSVDNLVTALRAHRVTGAGFEENISLIASARGFYHLHAASGSTDQYPLYVGSGYDPDGSARRQVTIDGVNGIVTIGGSYGSAAAEFGYRPQATGDVNRFRFDSATTGNSPAISAIGPDSNINVLFAAKGTGFIQTNSELRFNAAIYPNVDNAYTVGRSGLRASQIWAANGTIQTSDANMKMDVVNSDLGLDFVNGLRPVSYKFKVGGNVVTEVEDGYEEVEVQATETVDTTEVVNEIKDFDGVQKYVRSYVTKKTERLLFDQIDVVDENGNFLETINKPRMVKVKQVKTKQEVTAMAGKRTHYGLISQEVKALMDKLGVDDFGGYVEGEDGTLGLRYEQFISPIIKAIQQLSDKINK